MENIEEYKKWKTQFLNNLINFNVESLLDAKKRLNHTKKNYE